jgi:hypothetical protein
MEGVHYRIPKEEHAFVHEVGIRRELILNDMIHRRICEDYELFVHVPH